jgi:hypothetical protein
MGILINARAKSMTRKQLSDLGTLQQETTIYNVPTPNSDTAMIRYLTDSLAWLDSFDNPA